MSDWLRIQTELLNKTRIFNLLQVLDRSPHTDKAHHFVVIDSPDWVNLVPLTEHGDIVMVRQYRHGSQHVTLEIPGGMIDKGESPDTAAKRECLEETGYVVEAVTSLGVINPNPALFDNELHTFVGKVVATADKLQVSETEHTEVELVSLAQARQYLLDGTIDHALVCATLWRFLGQADNDSAECLRVDH